MRTRSNLRKRVRFNAAVITVLHFFRKNLATGGVDTLTNNNERLIKTDANFFGGRADNSGCHECLRCTILMVVHALLLKISR